MRRRWTLLVLVAAGSAQAGDAAAKVDLRTPPRWKVGEVVSAVIHESADVSTEYKGPDGTDVPVPKASARLDAKFAQRCVEADTEGRLLRSLVRIDAWTRRDGSREDDCLGGALVDTGPDGWALVTASRNPTRAARDWLDDRFGGRDARGFSGGLAELGAPGSVAAGEAWKSASSGIGPRLVARGLSMEFPDRPWTFTLAEIGTAPTGPVAKVRFDEALSPTGQRRALGRAWRLAEGSSTRVHGSLAGTPGAWHRSGRVDVNFENDLRSSSGGAQFRVITKGRETEAWAAGGATPQMPVRPEGAPAPRTIRGVAPQATGDGHLEVGSQNIVSYVVSADGTPSATPLREESSSWEKEYEHQEADGTGPARRIVTFRRWTWTHDGQRDESLAGTSVSLSADGMDFVVGGTYVTAPARQWLVAHFQNGAVPEDALRAAITPSMQVALRQSWLTDPEATTGALRARSGFSVAQESTKGSASLVRVSSGPEASAELEYAVEAEIVPTDAPGGIRATGTLRVRGTAQGPVADWVRLGSYRDEARCALTMVAAGAPPQRLEVMEQREATCSLLPAERIAARKLTHAAADHMEKRDPDAAILDATKAIESDARFARAWAMRGLARTGKGDGPGALADHAKAIELEPGLPDPYIHRALQRSLDGDQKAALRDADRAIELAPRSWWAYFVRARVQVAKRDLKKAIEDYSQSIERRPRYVAAFQQRGVVRAMEGDLDRAIEDFTQVLEITPRHAPVLVLRGTAKARRKDLDGAIADFTRAVEIDPREKQGWYELGRIRNEKGDRPGAITALGRAVETDPAYAAAWNFRGHVRREHGDDAGAIADFTKVIELDPGYSYAWCNRGSAKAGLDDLEGAAADWRKAAELDPKDPAPLMHLARAVFRPALPTAPVVEGVRRAIAIDDDPGYCHLWLWLARARGGEEAAATKELKEHLASREPAAAGAWYPVLAGLLVGTVTEDATLAATKSADEATTRWRLCEAAFYAGMLRAIRGDLKGAVALLDRSIATRLRNYVECDEAKRWRRALLEAPAPK